MARYTGPKSKIARKFKEAIFGPDKALQRKNYAPGQHGQSKRSPKKSEYAIQLMEKQKAKYTYGVLERQFRKTFEKANRRAPSRVGAMPNRKTVLSRRASKNFKRFSPVVPLRRLAFSNVFLNWRSNTP